MRIPNRETVKINAVQNNGYGYIYILTMIAGCVVDMAHHDWNTCEAPRSARVENRYFAQRYAQKYTLK